MFVFSASTRAVEKIVDVNEVSGPRMDPCGTPQVIVSGCEALPSTTHNCFLLLR